MIPMRSRVVGMTVLLAGITYLDRAAIGVVAPQIMRDLELTTTQMSWVFSAFTIAYGIFEIPTAAWADKRGARSVVARIVTWWSAFTMATAMAWNYLSLAVIRFLFGVGEAGAWPCVGRVFSRWVPAPERGKVQGIFFAGAHGAGALTPLLVIELNRFLDWRTIFIVFGVIGLLWSALWIYWFRDEPRDKAGTSPAEVAYIEGTRGLPASHGLGRWTDVFKTPAVIPICLSHFANTYGTYFVITWLPTYLEKALGMSKAQIKVYAGLPMVFAVVADLTGGWLTDVLTRRFGLSIGRAVLSAVAYGLSALSIFLASQSHDGPFIATCIALAYGGTMFTVAAAFSLCIELGKENSAVMTATMNTAGQVGGALSPLVLAFLVETYHDWSLPLFAMSFIYLGAVGSWLVIAHLLRGRRIPAAVES